MLDNSKVQALSFEILFEIVLHLQREGDVVSCMFCWLLSNATFYGNSGNNLLGLQLKWCWLVCVLLTECECILH